MIITRTITELQHILSEFRARKSTIGLVPTMGALHDGHLSLIKEAKTKSKTVVCSIFVNPTQFNNISDFEKYPSTLDADINKLTDASCDVLFAPSASDMYVGEAQIGFTVGNHNLLLEGEKRPGHFNGVVQIVSKLFNIVQPNQVYFGQKDLQQCLLIQNLINDLSYPIAMNICDTVRETDGLAMSSRNTRLNESERILATNLYKELNFAKSNLELKSIKEIKEIVSENLNKYLDINLEYFEFLDIEKYQKIAQLPTDWSKIAIVVAAFVGNTRLIDNVIITKS